jgi:hypothetical protein
MPILFFTYNTVDVYTCQYKEGWATVAERVRARSAISRLQQYIFLVMYTLLDRATNESVLARHL